MYYVTLIENTFIYLSNYSSLLAEWDLKNQPRP
jgi:hypothetical protein